MTGTLCNIHQDFSSVLTRCPHKLVSRLFFGGGFFTFFFLGEVNFHRLHHKTLELLISWPLLKNLDFHQAASPPPETVGWRKKKLKRKQQPACDAEHTDVHTSSLRPAATPMQRWWDWMVLVSGTIPKKEGFLLMQ